MLCLTTCSGGFGETGRGGGLAPPLPVILWGTVSPDLEVSAKQKGFLTGPHSPTAPDGRLKAKGF